MPKITKIEVPAPLIKPRLKVAAYARVSMNSERLIHSLSAQISYYSDKIQKNPEWEYAGVYADKFVSGTSADNRPELQRMIADCEKGLINMILCKSISRFARNTVDLLTIVRYLKSMNIDVRFEKEGISTLSSEGEVLLTLLASFSEQESQSLSENLKWAIQKKFERGEPWGIAPYGYKAVGNDYILIEEEAFYIRKIYDFFLSDSDMTMAQIAKWLKENGCRCFTKQFVKAVLTNIAYTGDLMLQEHYSPKIRKIKKNKGEVPKYHVHAHHPAIISTETFEAVQTKIQEMKDFNPEEDRLGRVSCFSSKITCAVCGNHYVHYGKYGWKCMGKIKSRSKSCQNGNLLIKRLENACAEVLKLDTFDSDVFVKTVHNIKVEPDGTLIFTFYDGKIETARILFFKPEQKKHQDPHTQFYGYIWDGKQYVINESEAEVIRGIYKDYLAGVSISDIARNLINQGLVLRKTFSRKSILNYLSNVFYTGTRIYPAAYSGTGKEETVENDHPAIIDKDTFEKVRILREKSLELRYRAMETMKKKKGEA
ncbi:MAG: recombinase family protein [Oscillospiraceae bacterium]